MLRKEGDVWTERGKTWTIKNGIKKTVTKFTSIRKELQTPLCCPKCNKHMKSIDQHIYNYNKVCLDCTVEFEHELKKAGKYEEYEKARIEANIKGYVVDLSTFFDEYLADGKDNKGYITEDGDVESWTGNSLKRVKEIIKPGLDELKEKYLKDNDKVN